MTTKSRPGGRPAAFRCAECGWTSGKWAGRCGECQAWGTVAEAGVAPVRGRTVAAPVAVPARPIADVEGESAVTRPSGVPEFDRVLGGGLVAGATVLVAGEPGVGKSTLLLDVASRVAAASGTVLYVTGEESAAQVRLRAERIGALRPRLFLAAETDLATVLGHIEQVNPDLLVVDSVQTITAGEIDGTAGGVTQVREVTAALLRIARERSMATLLVGHVTKDGAIAGPRSLEHLVDVVCHFDGDRHSTLRMVRAVKNRYGPTDEVGCFELTESGITGLDDPSGLFLSQHATPAAGTCVTVTLEGRRPLVAEVQALVGPSTLQMPRRATSGLDGSRTAMVLAVTERRGRVKLGHCDIYVSTVGGVRISEPACDLAVVLAVASAACDTPLPAKTAAVGEVGLAGEVRQVQGVPRRVAEAARAGFTTVLVPPGSAVTGIDGHGRPTGPAGVRVIEVPDVATALRHLNLAHATLPRG